MRSRVGDAVRRSVGPAVASEWAPRWITRGLLVVLAAVSIHNAFTYPAVGGIDAAEQLSYAHTLVDDGALPHDGTYKTPPGYFVLAGGAIKLGDAIGLDQPDELGQLLNGLLAVGTALLVLALVDTVLPGRPWLRVLAVWGFVACPVALKTDAMFHPQPLVMFLSTLALLLAARMIRDEQFAWRRCIALGAVAGAAQLGRSAGIWALGVVLIALAAFAMARPDIRRRVVRALAGVAAVGVLVPLPWYVHLQLEYGNPFFGRSTQEPPAVSVPPAARARPVSFYVQVGLPEVFTAPNRETLARSYFPITYTEIWGDYFGFWSWGAGPPRPTLTPDVNRRLVLQSIVGILPTALALAGWLALLALAFARLRVRGPLVVVPLMPLAAFAGTLSYATTHISADGDTVKGMFLLPAIPALAVCFAFTADSLFARFPRLVPALAALIVVCGTISLEYGVA